MESWQRRDLAHIWHPCSQMKDYEAFPPIIIRKGRGVWLEDMQGKQYLDAVASWWVNLFGHAHPEISAAVTQQLQDLEHVIFANFSHEPAIRLAEGITALAPAGLNRVFFADNGSSAVEVALKMSFQYHQQTGREKRVRFLSLTDAYHGETLGALSVGDLDLYSRLYRPLMMETLRAQGPDCYRCPHGLHRDTCRTECFTAMEEQLERHQEELSAVIIEPMVQCAAGMKMYPAGYLKKLRSACDRYGIHLIADEIAVGFGRTGTLFASEQAEISPDFLCLSKGLTGGYVPMSLVLTTDRIYGAFYGEYHEGRAFLHSHSYTGNAVGCAAACAVLEQFRKYPVLERNRLLSRRIADQVRQAFDGCPHVGEFRQTGMIGALELVRSPESRKPFEPDLRLGYRIYRRAVAEGLLLRPLGNVLYFMPPYCITEDEVDLMVKKAAEAVRAELAAL